MNLIILKDIICSNFILFIFEIINDLCSDFHPRGQVEFILQDN